MKPAIAAVALLLCFPCFAAPRPYHLQLEANPSAPFPFLGKFGTITIDVYNGGFAADTLWLKGFSRNGEPNITVENPVARMYVETPVSEISSSVSKLAGKAMAGLHDSSATLGPPIRGKVHGVDAMRYRLSYAPQAYIDVWTTTVVPANPQLKRVVEQFVMAISPATAATFHTIPGAPVHVELNFSHYKKLALVRTKSLTFENAGEEDALKVGSFYFKAPMLDSIFK